ncbi:MAG: hypothetical protein ACKOTH_08405 [Solirubrobacterales bacterium]
MPGDYAAVAGGGGSSKGSSPMATTGGSLPPARQLTERGLAGSVVAKTAIACPQPRIRRAGGIILLLTLAGVFPANVQMAVDHERFRQIPREALYARLPFQLVFVAWVLAAMKPPAGR